MLEYDGGNGPCLSLEWRHDYGRWVDGWEDVRETLLWIAFHESAVGDHSLPVMMPSGLMSANGDELLGKSTSGLPALEVNR